MTHLYADTSFDPSRTYVSGSAVTAFGASSDHDDSEKCGSVCELPKGAVLAPDILVNNRKGFNARPRPSAAPLENPLKWSSWVY
jgi:hypothetical protein